MLESDHKRLSSIVASTAVVTQLIADRKLTSFINPFSYLQLRKMPEVLNAIEAYGFDGVALQRIYQIITAQSVDRVSFDFTSIADPVFAYCQENQLSMAIVGSDELSLQRFSEVLVKRYPNLHIAYTRNGYFSGAERQQAIADVVASKADVLLCGMGAVLQEQFLLDVRAAGWAGAGFTCGGFIHQTASTQGDYYPAWIDKYNLRFLYRIWDEPKLLRRYLIDYPQGIFYFVIDKKNRYE